MGKKTPASKKKQSKPQQESNEERLADTPPGMGSLQIVEDEPNETPEQRPEWNDSAAPSTSSKFE